MYHKFGSFYITQKFKTKRFYLADNAYKSNLTKNKVKIVSKSVSNRQGLTGNKASLYKTKAYFSQKAKLKNRSFLKLKRPNKFKFTTTYVVKQSFRRVGKFPKLLHSFKVADSFIFGFVGKATKSNTARNAVTKKHPFAQFANFLLKKTSLAQFTNFYQGKVQTFSTRKFVNPFASFFWTQLTFSSFSHLRTDFSSSVLYSTQASDAEQTEQTEQTEQGPFVPFRYSTQFFADNALHFQKYKARYARLAVAAKTGTVSKKNVSKLDRFLYTRLLNSILRAGLFSGRSNSTALRLNSLALRSQLRTPYSGNSRVFQRKPVKGRLNQKLRVLKFRFKRRNTRRKQVIVYSGKKRIKRKWKIKAKKKLFKALSPFTSRGITSKLVISSPNVVKLPYFTPVKLLTPSKKKRRRRKFKFKFKSKRRKRFGKGKNKAPVTVKETITLRSLAKRTSSKKRPSPRLRLGRLARLSRFFAKKARKKQNKGSKVRKVNKVSKLSFVKQRNKFRFAKPRPVREIKLLPKRRRRKVLSKTQRNARRFVSSIPRRRKGVSNSVRAVLSRFTTKGKAARKARKSRKSVNVGTKVGNKVSNKALSRAKVTSPLRSTKVTNKVVIKVGKSPRKRKGVSRRKSKVSSAFFTKGRKGYVFTRRYRFRYLQALRKAGKVIKGKRSRKFGLVKSAVTRLVPQSYARFRKRPKQSFIAKTRPDVPYGSKNSSLSRFTQLKNVLKVVGHTQRTFYCINGLSLTRYAFDLESRADKKRIERAKRRVPVTTGKKPSIRNTKPSLTKQEKKKKKDKEKKKAALFGKGRLKTSTNYLFLLDRQRRSQYRYVAVYIKDLVRTCFRSRYLKKAAYRANFFGVALAQLPRNRKETTFLRCARKRVKRFSSKRREIIGVRIRFQGRVNRWRRTKHRQGEKGNLTYYTYRTAREYGRAQCITRKGVVGIRIWIAYEYTFTSKLRKARLAYATLGTQRVSRKTNTKGSNSVNVLRLEHE